MIRFPPTRIIVAYDLSDASQVAWRHAVALARRCGASLEIVHVDWAKPGSELILASDIVPMRTRLIRARIRAEVGDGPKIAIVRGDPAACILRRARRADMKAASGAAHHAPVGLRSAARTG